jgi:hypothetical protein
MNAVPDMKNSLRSAALFALAMLVGIAATGAQDVLGQPNDDLTGAWHGHVQFTTGAFAEVKDLAFMYVFNAGGTMTESSNYDGVPPVPPAYGVWKKVGPRQYTAKYLFYWTKPPADLTEITKGGGWLPGGHGVLVQKITVAADGNSFDSTLTLEMFDPQGKSTDAASQATAQAVRIEI